MRTSLIVPAFNEQEALPLVLNEYYKEVDELIVVDDGSSDNTFAIASQCANDKIKVFKHEEIKVKWQLFALE